MAPQPDLDPVAVATVLAMALVGPEFAPIVGAYGVIAMGWFGGLLVYVWRTAEAERGSVVLFGLMTFILTLGGTVGLASLVNAKVGAGLTVLLFPLAVAIPAFGDRWWRIAAYLWAHRNSWRMKE